MSWISKTLAEIGDDLGVGPLEMGPEGVVAFDAEGDTVGIQTLDEAVLIYRISGAIESTSISLYHLMRLGHFDNLRASVLQTGLTADGRVCVATRIAARAFDRVAFRQAFEDLAERMHSIGALV